MTKAVVVGYHGHCFDGMSSAALVTRVLRELEGAELAFTYRGLDHQPGGSHVPEAILSAEINAVVDFRYSMSERLTWWFDHHVSGIVGDAERAHFAADVSGRKFFEPSYGSCCQLIYDTAQARFGLDLSQLANLVAWADRIDAARFPDAQMAVELREPALQLMTVIEAHGDDKFIAPRIERLASGTSLDELASARSVQKLFAPLQEEQQRVCERIRAHAQLEAGVVFFDLVGNGQDRYNKFIPYSLYPSSRYCVAVTAGRTRAKVSVGSNPWAPVPRTHNIAEICASFGGGGHEVVGAVSLPASDIERARAIARLIVVQLSQ
jgi:hypothetical protein